MKRNLISDDIYRINYSADSQISPDGKKVAFVVTKIDKESDCYQSDIWIAGEGEAPYQLTKSGKRNTFPKWSPDGSRLSFVSNRNGKNEMFISRLDNEAPEMKLTMPLGVTNPVWSPDGKKIAFISKKELYETSDIKRITAIKQRDEILGKSFDPGKASHIFVYDMESGHIKQVTPDDFNLEDPLFNAVIHPNWSNDSKKLTFVSKIQDERESNKSTWKANVFVADLEKESLEGLLKNTIFSGARPIWSKDDKSIYVVGHQNELHRATSQRLWRISLETRELEPMTKDFDFSYGYFTLNDTSFTGYSDGFAKLSESGHTLYFLAGNEGKTSVFALDIASKEVKCILAGKRNIYSCSYSEDTNRLGICYSSHLIPNDIAMYDIKEGNEVRLTELNKDFLDEVRLSVQEQIIYENDGIKQEGWIVKAHDFEDSSKCPTILNIHGGPTMQFGWSFTFEYQVQAAQGYNVIFCNPRGSRGYGQAFTNGIQDHFARNAYEDLMAFTDKAVELGYADEDNLLVSGQSYGGFMTGWIITQTDRFKAAIAQSGVYNWISMIGFSDLGYATNELLLIDEIDHVSDVIDQVWEVSSLAHARNVKTPVMILHSENDWRCPIQQAEEFYLALKRQGKDVVMLRFPDSNHSLLRNGIPSYRVIRLDSMTRYFDKYSKLQNKLENDKMNKPDMLV